MALPPLRTARWRVAPLLVVCGALVLFVAPLLLLLTGSLREPGLPPPRSAELWPEGAGLAAYAAAFRLVPMGQALLNSTLLVLVAVPLSVLSASWAGLALAHGTRRQQRLLLVCAGLLLMVPVTAVWLTRFALFKAMGLTGTVVPVVAPALMGGSPLFVLLYAASFRRVPAELFDAAQLEGAGAVRTWWQVAMPAVRPTTAAVALLALVLFWSNFVDPLLYLSGEETLVAPLALHALEMLGATQWPVLLAGAVVTSLPAVLAFLGAQRAFFGAERRRG